MKQEGSSVEHVDFSHGCRIAVASSILQAVISGFRQLLLLFAVYYINDGFVETVRPLKSAPSSQKYAF